MNAVGIEAINAFAGTAYVNYLGKSGDDFTLNFGRESVSLNAPAHFRLGLTSDTAALAMLKGALDSFVNRDSAVARALIPRDKEVNALNKQINILVILGLGGLAGYLIYH